MAPGRSWCSELSALVVALIEKALEGSDESARCLVMGGCAVIVVLTLLGVVIVHNRSRSCRQIKLEGQPAPRARGIVTSENTSGREACFEMAHQ